MIDRSDALDLATLDLGGGLLEALGPKASPLTCWPPVPPQEGRGIMLAGFPGCERHEPVRLEGHFGFSWALGIAKTVTHDQITWIVPSVEFLINGDRALPQNYDFGGASGGPLITSLESAGGLFTQRLAGIISEAHAELEYVIAKRADSIEADGTIGPLSIY